MLIIGTIQVILLCCGIASSVLVIPKPTPDIEDVSSYSITVNWTLPENELFDEFVVEMIPDEGDVMDFSPKDMRRTYLNLTPGTLYTFIIRTARDEEWSDDAVIIQDTIPLPPIELELHYFDTLVLTLEGPYFGNTAFTVQAPGVEANWKESTNGRSDCYYAGLEPDDGYQAIPGEKHEILKGDTKRQFIHLIPGKEYTVTIHASTCGEGHLGMLKSDGISASIKIPPADPPAILVEEVTETTAELTWDGEPIDGFYDDFEVVQVGDIITDITVDEPNDPRDLGRNFSQLKPCTKYEVDVYTLFEERRSRNPGNLTFYTRPYSPKNIFVEDFSETSLTLSWSNPNRNDIVSGYSVHVSPKTNQPVETTETSVKIEGLVPGTEYKVSIMSVCDNTDNTMSVPSLITQTTKPLPPQSSQQRCEYISEEPEVRQLRSLYDQVPWEAPEPSRINLTWTKPSRGSWDGFLVHFSPYEFEQGVASPASPIFLAPNVISTQITVPVSGRVITASIRTVSRNVASEPLVKQVFCGDSEGESTLRCRSMLLFWTIKITPIEDNTRLLIEIPNFPIYNATLDMQDLNEVLVFYNNTFTIRNPCEDGPTSKITVYPKCPDFLPFCPVIVRRICVHRRGDPLVQPDACCNSRLYNTNDEICCHNKLVSKFGRQSEECCVSKWYDRKSHRCCGDSTTTSAKGGTC